MKKIFFTLLVVSALSACNQTAKTPQASGDKLKNLTGSGTGSAGYNVKDTASSAPAMKFDKDVYNFNTIKPGDVVTHEFKFTNSGKAPLIITDAVASCGCTVPEWPKTPVKPGESGVIKVTFNSTGKNGLQDKMITITGNTVPAQSVVHLTGEVVEPKTSK